MVKPPSSATRLNQTSEATETQLHAREVDVSFGTLVSTYITDATSVIISGTMRIAEYDGVEMHDKDNCVSPGTSICARDFNNQNLELDCQVGGAVSI